MCLFTKQLLPRRAKEPITVYKMVYKSPFQYFTPFRHIPIKLKDCITATGPLTGCPRFDYSGKYVINTVSKGYIHAYKDFETAKDWCRFANPESHSRNYKVLMCVIEPGTLYYVGDTEICARSLTTKGIIY